MKMNKAILKNDMHVITRSGDEFIIMSNIEAIMQIHTETMVALALHHAGFIRIDKYKDDLTSYGNHNFDIMYVYTPHFYKYILSSVQADSDKFDLIAER